MSNTAKHDATLAPKKWCGVLVWVGLALALVVLILFRLHALGLPLETDECNYAYFGARLLAGDRLYVDLWDHQPPGVFVLFAGMIALFGDEPIVFRLMATAFSAVSLVLIFAMLRRWHGAMIATAGGLLFAVVSSDPGTAGEGCNREIYMNTFVLGAWLLATWGGCESRRGVFAAGLLLGWLNLVDGQTYTLSLFYAHRRATTNSIFGIRTNLELFTTGGVTVTAAFD